ncbi:MAG: putative addiction module killer protein [bacterium]|jgi:putative addiction module killer protein
MSKVIKYFKKKNGKEPFIEWLDSLDSKNRYRIITRIERLEVGNAGTNRHLDGGLFELKIDIGPGYRVYYGEVNNEIVLLISGGEKNSQEKDIKKARSYWDTFKQSSK